MAIDKGFQWSSDPQTALRMQMAQGLMRGSQAPAQGFGENAANLGSKLLGAYMARKVMDEGKDREQARSDTLANALRAGQGQAAETKSYGDGTTINWDERKADPDQMAAILMGNRDTAGMGLQMQMGQMDEKRKNEAATAAALLEHNRAIERDRLKPLDMDRQWFVPDMPGQAPQAAPAPAPQAPGGGVDMRTASAPPTPLTPNAQGLPAALAASESGNRPGIVNDQGYSGTYQFGEAAATAAGFYTPDSNPNDNKWGGTFKNLPGVTSHQDFLKNPQAQDLAFKLHQDHLGSEITNRGLDKYIGQTVGGVPITREGLTAMMHLGGPTGVQKFIESGGRYNPADSNGTKLSDYGTKFAGAGQAPQAPPAPVRVADASGAFPASAFPTPGRTTMGGQSGTVVGGQGGPAFRPLTPEERAQYNIPAGQAAQIDRKGNIKTIGKEQGVGGGPFGGPGDKPAMRNLYIQLQTKVANGETLSQQEQLAMAMIQQEAEQERIMMTDQGVQRVPGMPLPTLTTPPPAAPPAPAAPSPAQVASTDTVPNPLQPPAPAEPPPAPEAPPPAPAAPPAPAVVTSHAAKPPTVVVPNKAKAIPEVINRGMMENVNAIRKVDETLAAITKTPDATGWGPGVVNAIAPNAVTNSVFPEGTRARALIAEIGAMKIHDRAGASQTAGEMENLKPYIPKMTDSAAEIRTKLEAFRNEYMNMLNDTAGAYGAEAGYQTNPVVAETIKTGRAAGYKAPMSGEDPNKPKSTLSGVSNEDILKQLGM
jgi:hypothetical protein